jgi:hypothetical protein
MTLKYYLVFLSVFFYSDLLLSQQLNEIENKAENIILSLSIDKVFPDKDFSDLKNFFSGASDSIILETKYQSTLASFDSLAQHLNEYKNEKENVSADSALNLFVDWYLHFQRTFYNYNKQNFFDSPKKKILFFSTSMSCHCTLEMCKKQLVEILKLKRDTGDSYSFLVVDSYWNNDLQLNYETYFAPSALVFNQSNELILKIEYEEEMIEQLTEFLFGSDKI